jgi:tight adherence protein B
VSLTYLVLASLSSLIAYAVVSGALERRWRKHALGMLRDKPAASRQIRRRAQPLLIAAAHELRGRIATRALERLHLKESAERLLDTAGMQWGAAGLLHRLTAAFLLVFAVITAATANALPLLAMAGGLAATAALVTYVRRQARRRVRAFEEEFPDCLEFLSRSMRAGHAFSVAVEMVSREFGEPLAGEFRRTFEEQNFGQPLDLVLKKLAQRVPSMDVQFFVSAVLLQKRTGGNLAELLDKLAYIIRERFKLRARIRAISAQGLMSGRILTAIPAAVGGLMFAVNPQYTRFFFDDSLGHELLAGALGLQVVGYVVIRKIVMIEV